MKELIAWLKRNFKVSSIRKNEVRFPCPKCSHPSFYFNVKTRVGYCHKAKCHWTPVLEALVELVGHGPGEIGWTEEEEEEKEVVVTLPGDPIVYRKDGQLYTDRKFICDKVGERGVSPEDQYRFNLTYDDTRVYIPVYNEGKLVNYVGRLFWWLDTKDPRRYQYCPGISTANYLYNWDNAKHWNRLTLVENSFNAIWLNDLQCTTNFGSHLSDTQAAMICSSKVESVLLIWDEGAEHQAERAVRKIGNMYGTPAAYARIEGQPDDHDKSEICAIMEEGHQAALRGEKRF